MAQDYSKLPIVVFLIILVGMLVGVGVLTLDKFSSSVADSVSVINESFTAPQKDEVVSLANGNITAFTRVINTSGFAYSSGNYSVNLLLGILNNTGNQTPCVVNETCYAFYTYDDQNSKAAVTARKGRDAIGEVSTVWLSLIVTIAALAIIIMLVIKGFAFRKR